MELWKLLVKQTEGNRVEDQILTHSIENGKSRRVNLRTQTPPHEIVDIHFSYQKFKTYELLIELDQLTNEGQKDINRAQGDRAKCKDLLTKKLFRID